MHFNIITIFPEMFPGTLGGGVIGRALKSGIWSYSVINPRDFTDDLHRTVDDAAFGGIDGQVMLAEPIAKAIEKIRNPNEKQSRAVALAKADEKIIYFSPRGKLLNQKLIRNYNSSLLNLDSSIILICGRYEGIDQRLIEEYNVEEISIGDYILSGGELAAEVFIDSCVRLCDNVLHGGDKSIANESFEIGGLEWPLFTRPHEWRGRKVPEVLVSGHHGNIERWRKEQSLAITKKRRPELIRGRKKQGNM